MTSNSPPSSGPSRCPACNSPLAPNAKFCETCGAKIEQVPVCRNCGAPLPAGMKFCENCGAAREAPLPAGEPAPARQPDPAPAPVAPAPAPATPPVPEKKAAPVLAGQPPDMPKKAPAVPEKTPDAVSGAAGAGISGQKKTLIVAGVAAVVVIIIIALFVLPMLSAGSGGATGAKGGASLFSPAPSKTAGIPASGSPSSGTAVPGPTQTIPSQYSLSFQVDKDTISGDVTVTVTGPSRNVVRDVSVTLNRADGQSITKNIPLSQKVNEVTIPGTRNPERVEATVYFYSGEQYKVIDQIADFGKRM